LKKPAAKVRATSDNYIEHARNFHINTKEGGPIDFRRQVLALGSLANETKIAGILEFDYLDIELWQLDSGLDERAVGQPPSRKLVNHRAAFSAACFTFHGPGLRGSLNDHPARLGSRMPQLHPRPNHSAATSL